MENYGLIFLIPISWFIISLMYQILSLFCIWLKFKLENIKEIIK